MNNDFYLLLPNIRSCHNVGAMFRTADAFSVDKLFLIGYTAAPPKIQIDKVSLGAEKWIPFEQVDISDFEKTIISLKEQDFEVIALEKNDDSVEIGSIELEKPIVLIVGNEVDGVDDSILQLCDRVVHIPMLGKKESLNVSVAAGIAMHTLRSKLP